MGEVLSTRRFIVHKGIGIIFGTARYSSSHPTIWTTHRFAVNDPGGSWIAAEYFQFITTIVALFGPRLPFVFSH
jgi:hypothetical protein